VKPRIAIAAAALLCGTFGATGAAEAADSYDNYAGVMGLAHFADKRLHLDNGYGGRGYYGWAIAPGTLNLEFNLVGYDSNPNHKEYVHMGQYGGGVDLIFPFLEDSAFKPFWILGGGLIWSDGGGYGKSENRYANFGLGGTHELSRRWSVRLESRGIALFPDSNNKGIEEYPKDVYTDVVIGLGLQYFFVDELPPAAVREPVRVVAVPGSLPGPCQDSDGDGVCDERDQCPQTLVGVAVDARGCPFDTDGDGVPDHLDKCPSTPRGLKVDVDGCVSEAQTIILQNVNFEFDKDQLTSEAEGVLHGVAQGLLAQKDLRVELAGHTDSKGSNAYNQSLSDRRAASVRRFLLAQGVPGSQFQSKGYGENQPIDTNETDEGRARNRRVEFKVLR
jgi:OOP family OmpA-OmpF porin